jgi:VanZ family protein
MFTPSSNPHPRDRRTDRSARSSQAPPTPGAPEAPVKPAVLRRSTLRAMCAVWLGLVIYGTLGPLGYRGDERLAREWIVPRWLAPADGWRWFPPGYPVNYDRYNDIFTNVLVYVPVGIALALLVRRRGGARRLELLLAMSLAVSLSYATELLQQFMPARCCDRGDLLVNAGAALLGCLIAPHAQRAIRRGHAQAYERWLTHPWLVLAWATTGVTLMLMTLPWDFYWPSIEVDVRRELDVLDFRRFAMFGLLGFVIAMAMLERCGRWGAALRETIKRVFVYAVLFESAQIFVKSHACGLLDMGTALLGGLVGMGLAWWLAGGGAARGSVPRAARRALATMTLLALVLLALIAGLFGSGASSAQSDGQKLLWSPFQVQFLEPFDRVLVDTVESLLVYGSVTMLCLYLTGGRGRRVGLLLLVGMVGVMELGRVLKAGGTADATPLILAVAAWWAAVRCWDAFLPQRRHRRPVLSEADVVG